MSQQRLKDELGLVANRYRESRLWSLLAVIWIVFTMIGCALQLGYLSPVVTATNWLVFGFSLLATTFICFIASRLFLTDRRWLATQIENQFPDLDSRLITAVQEMEDGKPLGYLQQRVIDQTLSHGRIHSWISTVHPTPIYLARTCVLVCLLVLAAICFRPINSGLGFGTAALLDDEETVQTPADKDSLSVVVVPGTTEVERGRPLVITAEFSDEIATAVELMTDSASDSKSETYEMSRSLNDPLFARRLARVDSDFSYSIKYGSEKTEIYQVKVYDLPRLEQLDVKLVFPSYTKQDPRTVLDTRRVTAVEGTQLEIICRLNKAVDSCLLKDDEFEIKLTSTGEPNVYQGFATVEKTQRFALHLIDADDRENREKDELTINSIKNRPPEIVVTLPGKDINVSPLEELELQAKIIDDFGAVRYGFSYYDNSGTTIEHVIGQDSPGNKPVFADHMLFFEELQAKPGDSISYFFWAEDVDAKLNPRRIVSDMFFVDVRPFEEIFRQLNMPASEPSEQEKQQQKEIDQLLVSQKQIISATWNLVRQSPDRLEDTKLATDIQVVEAAQRQLAETVAESAQETGFGSPEKIQAVVTTMNRAADILKTASTSQGAEITTKLQDAIPPEQDAYRQLLRMRPTEHTVTQSPPSQSSSSQSNSSRSQQQLQQLNLSKKENRYEQEEKARQEQTEQQKENREVLNRLQELAQRQSDLNKQLKELQNALEEAKSEEEREEIRRQLKRLREEQEEILRDIDQLKEKTENSQNQQEMQETTRELEKARQEVRRSSEALDQQKISQAAAAGQKAQEQFEELKEEMRKRTANQFAEQMKDMKQKASELEKNQEQIQEKLEKTKQKSQKSLRDPDHTEDVKQALKDQKDRLNNILDEMQNVVQEAETSEPLLSKELYETFRKTKQNDVEQTLEETEDLVSRGLADQSRESGRQAKKGIEELKEGIDRASEKVLGNEEEALRRAKKMLEDLSKELKQEISGESPDNNSEQDNAKGNQTAREGDESSKESERSDAKSNNKNSSKADPESGQAENESNSNPNQSKSKESDSKENQKGSGESEGQEPRDNQSKSDQPNKGESGKSESQENESTSENGKPSNK